MEPLIRVQPRAVRPWATGRLASIIAVLAMAVLIPSNLTAQQDLPYAAATALPASAEVAIVLDGASRIRMSAAGTTLSNALTESGLLAESNRAWDDLARVLGLRREDALDALLGRRVVFVMTGLRPDSPPGWAIVAQVSPEIERRLRAGLGAAPRQVVVGQPILSVEQGRYELASAVFKDAGASPLLRDDGRAGPVALVLLAPTGNSSLFDAMLPLVQGRAAGTPFGDSLRQAAAHRASDGLLIARLPAGGSEGDRYAAVALHAQPDAWIAETIAWPARLWLPGVEAERVGPWSRHSFDVVSKDALVSVVGMLGTDGPPRELMALAGPAAPMAWPEGLDPLQAGRAMLTVQRGTAESVDPYGLSVSVAVQVRDIEASARTCDRLVARSLTVAGRDNAAADFEGFLPGAIRTAEIGVAPGRTTTIAWAFERDTEARSPDAPRSGWWVMAIGPAAHAPSCSTSLVRRTAAALTQPDVKAESHRRISLGVARPAQVVSFVVQGNDVPPGPLSLLRAIDMVEWDAWIEDDTIRAESMVRFAPAQGR
ncbi:MAG: hypothetical protein KIS87_06895 [Phycisphaeraceae bacterium]|nr:hypothetical protein [Phycisphaeraceae bacterium]